MYNKTDVTTILIIIVVILVVIWLFNEFRTCKCYMKEGIDVLNILPPEIASSGYAEASNIIGQSLVRTNNEREISKSVLQRNT